MRECDQSQIVQHAKCFPITLWQAAGMLERQPEALTFASAVAAVPCD